MAPNQKNMTCKSYRIPVLNLLRKPIKSISIFIFITSDIMHDELGFFVVDNLQFDL